MDNFTLYSDIKARTDGEIYIGVVGPVRTGKSTFIKRFIDQMILPGIKDSNEKERIIDELPQSAAGKTVMTTEPKFIPKDSVEIELESGISAKFRLIDSVGFLINGAQGIYEDEKERQVKTPWFNEEISFTKAAEYGTGKVIKDHSTIGIVVTTDGSIGEIPRKNYIEAEDKTIAELKRINKPFIVIVNSKEPGSLESQNIVNLIEKKHKVTAIAINCNELSRDDINNILLKILYEFPVNSVEFYLPKWVDMLPLDHEIKKELINYAFDIVKDTDYIKNINKQVTYESEYIASLKYDNFDFNNGCQRVFIAIDDKYYFKNLSELTGEAIEDEYELISLIKSMAKVKKETGKYIDSIDMSKNKGYAVVLPDREEISFSEPELIKNGNRFGVKIKAQSPSVHMIKVNIGTEISPIVGSEEQAKDLIRYLTDNKEQGTIWDTSIFGKSVGQLIEDGIRSKITMLGDDCQEKLIGTMQRVVNETSGGLVCLII